MKCILDIAINELQKRRYEEAFLKEVTKIFSSNADIWKNCWHLSEDDMKKYQPDQPHEADPCRKPPAKYVPRSRPGRPGGRGFGRDDDDDDRRGFEGLPPA